MRRCFIIFISIILTFLIFSSNFSEAQYSNRDICKIYKRKDNRWWGKLFNTLFNKNEFNKSYAFVIGLSDYYEEWKPLESPYEDAIKVSKFLENTAGFDYVVTLTNKMATMDSIFKYMEEIFPNMLKKNDRFLFYYSGHGTQRKLENRKRGYLPMLDSGQKTWSNMISMDDIEDWNENILKTKHVLFVLDCCFSGSAGIQSSGRVETFYLDDLLKYGHHLITAGTEDENTYSSLNRWGGSLFTDTFVKGISGKADAHTEEYKADGIVSLTELYEYIRKRVNEEAAKNKKVKQTPQYFDLSKKRESKGEFFFITEEIRLNYVTTKKQNVIEFGWPVEKKGELKDIYTTIDTTAPSPPKNVRIENR